LILLAFGASAALTGLPVNSNGGAVIADVPFAVDPTSHIGFGVYRVHAAAAVSQKIAATFVANTNCYSWLVEAANVGAFDSSQTTVATGSAAAVATTVFTPSQAGALLLACGGSSLARTLTGWGGSFTGLSGSRTSGPTAFAAYYDQAAAAPVQATNTLSSAAAWAALAVSYVPSGVSPAPTLTSVNSGATIAEASANVTVVGTNLSGATIAITQGTTSVSQTANAGWGATGGTFNLVMEPGGAALNFGAATLKVTAGGQTATLGITLAPLAGLVYVLIGTPNTNSAERITTTPVDLASGDQLEVSGNAAGTAAVPAGLTINTDGTQQWANGATLANFYARAWDATDSTWGTWSLQTAVQGSITITVPANLIHALQQFFSLLPG
jgi:hypothetical protein